MISNLPWIVYRCDRIGRGETPENETEVARAATASEAFDKACELRRSDNKHSYTVGGD